MFASLARQIRRLPWWGQALAWPIYWITRLLCSILGWMLEEMGMSAKKGAKKVFSPLLWPTAIVLAIGLLYLLVGPQALGALLHLALALGLIGGVLYFAVFGRLVPKKKEKKKH